MKLSRKIAILFISLMAAAILLTIGYSILFIRNHLYEQKHLVLRRFVHEAMATPTDAQTLCRMAARRGFLAAVLDEHGKLLCADNSLAQALQGMRSIPREDDLRLYTQHNMAQGGTLILALEKDTVLEELRPIRWIIYHAMFITLGLVVLAAMLLSLALSRPIIRIKRRLEELASGRLEHLQRDTHRKDEIGMIARALNSISHNLQRDNERLRLLNQQQARFYTDIAHELNNPLHAMRGALDMLRLKQDDPQARLRYLDILSNQTERMARLFHDVLTLQQAEDPDALLNPTAFDLQTLAHKVALPYMDALQQLGLQWQMEVPALRVYADASRIEQVLDNLLSNALKYCRQGKITLRAALADSGRVQICLSDTGPGIAPEHLPLLTNRFYRTDNARARNTGGTGLGLAVVKTLLEAHGTSLQIYSQLGQGSSFCFELPLAPDVA